MNTGKILSQCAQYLGSKVECCEHGFIFRTVNLRFVVFRELNGVDVDLEESESKGLKQSLCTQASRPTSGIPASHTHCADILDRVPSFSNSNRKIISHQFPLKWGCWGFSSSSPASRWQWPTTSNSTGPRG